MTRKPDVVLQYQYDAPERVRLLGDLTHITVASERLLNELIKKQHKTVYFDLSEVDRVDTAGLAWLIHCFSDLRQRGVRLELQHIPDQLQKLMLLGQVSNLFE